jgi:foldase protein PrsA
MMALILTGCNKPADPVILATVNGEEIFESDLTDRLAILGFIYQMTIDRDTYGEEMLNQLIEERLLIQEAVKKEVVLDDAELDEQFTSFTTMLTSSYGGEVTMNTELRKAGLKLDDFKSLIATLTRVGNLIDLLTKDITISESEVRAYYDSNPEEFISEESVRASHILVADAALAAQVLQQLKDGADFAAMAAQYSTDSANKNSGGDLGFFTYGDMVEPFEDAAFALEVGDLSEVVQTEFGYHIIKLTDTRPQTKKTYEEAKEEVQKMLLSWAQEDFFEDYVDQIWEASEIVITE